MGIMNKHLYNSLKTETFQLKTITAKLNPYTTSSIPINGQQYQVGFKHQQRIVKLRPRNSIDAAD